MRSMFFIGVFYTFVIVCAISFLAAVQLRAVGGAKYDFWRLNYDGASRLAGDLQAQSVINQDQLSRNQDNLLFANECLKFFEESGQPKAAPEPVQQQLTAYRSENRDYDTLPWTQEKCLYRGYFAIKIDQATTAARIEALRTKGSDLRARIDANDALLKSDIPDFLAFKKMEDVWYLRYIVLSPYDVLVQILVVLMGAMGGMVRILREYGDKTQDDPPLRDYFILPLIGAVVGFGGYILAKTGLLLLSTTNGEASLSPFMVSFVGIISGLLAKEVIDRIASAGRDWLNGSGGRSGPKGDKPAAAVVETAAREEPIGRAAVKHVAQGEKPETPMTTAQNAETAKPDALMQAEAPEATERNATPGTPAEPQIAQPQSPGREKHLAQAQKPALGTQQPKPFKKDRN